MNKVDPLQELLKTKEKSVFCSIPPKYDQIFKTREYDLEYFGLTFFQRGICFIVFLIVGTLSFFYSMLRVFTAFLYPAQFALPYAFSNFIFFFMFGFIKGFKSYLNGLFSEKRRIYTGIFIMSTFLTLYGALVIHSYLINLLLCLIQIGSFILFALTALPGGTSGISSMLSLVMRK